MVLHPGLPMFIAAIVMNMIVSESMCHLEQKPKKRVLVSPDGGSVYVSPNDNSSWRKVVVPILLLLNAVGLVLAISSHIMRLPWFMLYAEFNIWNFGMFMGEDKYYLFSLMVFCFLVIAPTVKLIAITIFWYAKVKVENLDKCN